MTLNDLATPICVYTFTVVGFMVVLIIINLIKGGK